MHRFPRFIVLAVAAAVLLSSVAQAAKPVTVTGTPAWADSSGNNPIAIEGGFVPAVITVLTLPADGKFVINATVLVFNNDFDAERKVNCQLRHGVLPGGGTVLDFAETILPPATLSGIAEAKFPLTGAIERVAAPTEVKVFVACSSEVAAGAQFGQLNAVSVSSLTFEE